MVNAGEQSLRKINNILSLLVAVLAVYILSGPILPNLFFWINRFFYGEPDQPQAIVQQVQKIEQDSDDMPAENTLLIPSINLSVKINEGTTTAALSNNAAWRRPNTAAPDKNGNTVVVGHRFTNAGTGIFYHLDKVKIGDKISVYWQSKLYNYEVTQVIIVEPQEVGIEGPAPHPILTLYTCTPLWTAKQRLVVRALPIGENP